MSQALPEQITFYGRDDFGVVQVRAKDHQRWLTFGNDVEQSCIDIRHPYSHVHVYLHGMLIAPLTLCIRFRRLTDIELQNLYRHRAAVRGLAG